MSRVPKLIPVVLTVMAGIALAEPVIEEATWQESYAVSGPAPRLVVANVWGAVSVGQGASGEIRVTVRQRISAPDRERLDRAKKFFAIDVEAAPHSLEMHVGRKSGREWQRDACRHCRADYEFDIVVPADAIVDVATVNDGRVEVDDVRGAITARNVNGPIALTAVDNCANVDAVNGDVRVEFARGPTLPCAIETFNGDIALQLPPAADFDVALDLFNGRTLSEFDVAPLAIAPVVEKAAHDGGYSYRISQSAGARIGRGGVRLTITSLNGDVHILKKP